MAFRKACSADAVTVKNTGVGCSTAMLATAMIIAIDPDLKWTKEDQGEDPYDWLEELVHMKKAWPLFGIKAPIRAITNNTTPDVTITLDDGSIQFVRFGIYNRTLQTTAGGLCYAEALMSFLNSGKSLLEVDKAGKLMQRQNADKTYSGLITDSMYGMAPQLANFTDVYRNQFQYSLDPVEMVNNGVIFEDAGSLLSMMGLLDLETTVTAQTTTTVTFGVNVECGGTDIISLVGAPLAATTNWIIRNKATGAIISTTAGAIVGGKIQLTGTFPAGTYTLEGASPIVWYDADIKGYDASTIKTEFTVS